MNKDFEDNSRFSLSENMMTQIISDEEPEIVIEHYDDPQPQNEQLSEFFRSSRNRMKRILWAAISLVVVLAIVLTFILTRQLSYPHPPILPASSTEMQNINRLMAPVDTLGEASINVTEDSINGVSLVFYRLDNLKAELSFTAPADTDSTVYLYTRCADYRADNRKILCDCVIEGEQISEGNNRSGYFASVRGNMVIGVALTDSVKKLCEDYDGYYFRQFAIVSKSLKGDVRLKGKKFRRALAFQKPDSYYVIESKRRESLHDFTEAIEDYGFTDAIFLTGGDDYSYWRDRNKTIHPIGNPSHRDVGSKNSPLLYLIFKSK